MKCHLVKCCVVYYIVTGEVSLLTKCHLVKCCVVYYIDTGEVSC